MTYIQVCLPLRLEWNPWYSTTEEVHVGQRVSVRFARKPYVGVVVSVGGQPDVKNVFAIDSADTGLEDISEAEMKLWEFVSSYYMCTLGEVYKVAYPIAKVRGEMQALRMGEHSAQIQQKKRSALEAKIAKLEKSVGLREKALQGKHNDAVTARLEEELSRLLEQLNIARVELEALGSEPVHKAFQNTIDFREKPVLLRGTDRVPYYLDEIRRTLDAGRSVLILEPETDFGFNLRDALGRGLGERLLFYGATSTDKQKREVMQTVRDSSSPVAVIGVRSALFLPWTELGLVIVDEEQDVSFKQSEPAPLYNGRDVAAMLARLHGARLILGSACPSLESLSNCLSGKYELMPVSETLPAVEIIDIPAEKHKRGMVGNYSRRALDEIRALPADALITVVRCYQTEDDAVAEMRSLLSDRDPQLLTAVAARKSASHSALTLVLQADALFDRSDFRADEKALQLLCSIRLHTDRLLVQCGAASHPVYRALASDGAGFADRKGVSAALGELLAERKSFGLPPYTRLVDMYDKGGSMVRREVLQRDSSLASRKAELKLQYGALYTFDVDPL
ncbi:MAG: hypothetical protein J5740_01595 [Bacteroidales bacterium]|nr:hypothetical protein [Bacteroidales bacterium]